MAALPSPVDARSAVLERGYSPDTIATAKHGPQHRSFEKTDPVVARVEAILSANGWLEGAADPRGNAKAEGY